MLQLCVQYIGLWRTAHLEDRAVEQGRVLAARGLYVASKAVNSSGFGTPHPALQWPNVVPAAHMTRREAANANFQTATYVPRPAVDVIQCGCQVPQRRGLYR